MKMMTKTEVEEVGKTVTDALKDEAHNNRVISSGYLREVAVDIAQVQKLLNEFEWERDPRKKHNLFRSVEHILSSRYNDIVNNPGDDRDKFINCFFLNTDYFGYYPPQPLFESLKYRRCTVSMDALAILYGVSKSTIHDWCDKGKDIVLKTIEEGKK